jgi:hypothetical protein
LKLTNNIILDLRHHSCENVEDSTAHIIVYFMIAGTFMMVRYVSVREFLFETDCLQLHKFLRKSALDTSAARLVKPSHIYTLLI